MGKNNKGELENKNKDDETPPEKENVPRFTEIKNANAAGLGAIGRTAEEEDLYNKDEPPTDPNLLNY